MKRISNRRGMTLVEIMIVLAIIGSIMALLLPRLTGASDKANVREAKIKMGQIVNALAMYYTDCGKYPQSLKGLIEADPSCSNWGPEAYMRKEKGSDSIQDPWHHDFEYQLNGAEYTLKCLGKDGAEGGTGFNADFTQEDL